MWESLGNEGNGGLSRLTLYKMNSNNKKEIEYSVEIYHHGATVTSWKHQGREQIFVSSLAVWNGVKAIRGGIPVVWPQFGQPNPSMPQHGFLRTSTWAIHEIHTSENDASVTFILHSSPETLALWPHIFRATYTVTISEGGLACSLKTYNTGDSEFKCHALLHTYFSLPSIQEVGFSGYHGLQYADKTRQNNLFEHEEEQPFLIGEEVDRVYISSNETPIPDITILHTSSNTPIMTIQKSAHIESQFSSFQSHPCDCVLWNPWIEKSRALNDMDDDGYLSFVCVEPGVVAEYVTIPPGHALNLSQMLIPGDAR